MIDAATVRRMRANRAEELHIQLCAKIEQAIKNAAMDSFTELLVQLPSEIQHAHPASIRLNLTLMILSVCNVFCKLLVITLTTRRTRTVL